MAKTTKSHWLLDARFYEVLLGIFVMGFGLYSHYESGWMDDVDDPFRPGETMKPDRICILNKRYGNDPGKPCPSLAMERYYIAVIIICCVISTIGLIGSWLIDLSSQALKSIDLTFHVLAFMLMLSAGIIYIVSAEQINNLYGFADNTNYLKRKEKLIAAAFAILQAFLYAYVAIRIKRQ